MLHRVADHEARTDRRGLRATGRTSKFPFLAEMTIARAKEHGSDWAGKIETGDVCRRTHSHGPMVLATAGPMRLAIDRKNDCSVEATSDNNLIWSWKYQRARLSDLDKKIIANNPLPVDASSEFALWNWQVRGEDANSTTHQAQDVCDRYQRAQLLSQDGGLYLLPIEGRFMSICQYLDFASMRLRPQKLSFQTAKQLTKALCIINPNITDVRLKDVQSGLSVVLSDNNEVSLGTIGNGAVTWASALIAIFGVMEETKNQPRDMPIIILLDEMGAGIHYSIMQQVWEFLKFFCKDNRNVQFVFTSHSDDCIRAFCNAFLAQDDASVVRLHQTSVEKKVVYTEYRKESFNNIMEGEWEVRG